MISHKHKTIFVHIPKAAGTSIERVFMEDLGLNMDNRHALMLGETTNKTMGPRRVSHLLAREYVKLHFISQELFDTYYKFSIVRHPYDRLYSSYKYRKYNDYLSFDSYIKYKLPKLYESDIEGFFYRSQYEYLYSDNGELLVDYVGKLESIDKDFNQIKKNINIRNCELKHYNKSKEEGRSYKLRALIRVLKDYKSFGHISFSNRQKKLSIESKKIVMDYYKEDFETFGYNQ